VTDPIDRAFRALQLEYLASMPARLEELRADAAGFRAGNRDATDALKVRLHRLAGSGGSYGFSDLSSIAREAQQWLARFPSPGEADQLEMMVDRMEEAVEEAGRRVGG
jgi:HPt (histidine-containing phosphotransfer) domain-containing protein